MLNDIIKSLLLLFSVKRKCFGWIQRTVRDTEKIIFFIIIIIILVEAGRR